MPRLRVTSGLSLLLLGLGIVGTGWLSSFTEIWPGPPQRYLAAAHTAARVTPRTIHASTHVTHTPRRPRYRPAVVEPTPPVAPATPELVPVATPSDNSQPWDTLRGHLDGRVVLHVDIDASGRVAGASLSQSSGDPVLDQHALRSVRGWRFAVPGDHPDGFSGELPMRFSSQGDGVARVP